MGGLQSRRGAAHSDTVTHDATSPLSYESRVAAERAIFDNQIKVHDLPDVHHYWANKHVRPKLETFGFSTPDDLFYQTLHRQLKECSRPLRFLSVGSGNCDREIGIAVKLGQAAGDIGFDFTIECLDLNPAMLERGRADAKQAGVNDRFEFVIADLNSWEPSCEYDAVIANQSLHHVVDLEHLFDGIRRSLTPGAPFAISDMIGRNGHRRWPEARAIVEEFWRKLPPSYRFNRALNRFEEQFEDSDCSTEGFEGIRSQDILPLLNQIFHFEFFFGFANVIDPFVDRQFGHHFDPGQAWVRRFIDEVHYRDEAEQLAGKITPAHMLAVVMAEAPARRPVFYPLPPGDSVRVPDDATPAAVESAECAYDCPAWWLESSQTVNAEFAFLSGKLRGSQQEVAELMRWGAALDRQLAERTAWALKLEQELDERTVWALDLERRLAERTSWALDLEQKLAERTAWAMELDKLVGELRGRIGELQRELLERTDWALERDRSACALEARLTMDRAQGEMARGLEADLEERTQWARLLEKQSDERREWALRLQDQLQAERQVAAQMVYLRPAVRRVYLAARAIWHRLPWRRK